MAAIAALDFGQRDYAIQRKYVIQRRRSRRTPVGGRQRSAPAVPNAGGRGRGQKRVWPRWRTRSTAPTMRAMNSSLRAACRCSRSHSSGRLRNWSMLPPGARRGGGGLRRPGGAFLGEIREPESESARAIPGTSNARREKCADRALRNFAFHSQQGIISWAEAFLHSGGSPPLNGSPVKCSGLWLP